MLEQPQKRRIVWLGYRSKGCCRERCNPGESDKQTFGTMPNVPISQCVGRCARARAHSGSVPGRIALHPKERSFQQWLSLAPPPSSEQWSAKGCVREKEAPLCFS